MLFDTMKLSFLPNRMPFDRFFIDNWRQVKAWMMPFAGAFEASALAERALRRFTQRPCIEHPTFQSTGGPLSSHHPWHGIYHHLSVMVNLNEI